MVVVIFSVVVVIIVVLTLIINIIAISMWWASWILQLRWHVVNSCHDCLKQLLSPCIGEDVVNTPLMRDGER